MKKIEKMYNYLCTCPVSRFCMTERTLQSWSFHFQHLSKQRKHSNCWRFSRLFNCLRGCSCRFAFNNRSTAHDSTLHPGAFSDAGPMTGENTAVKKLRRHLPAPGSKLSWHCAVRAQTQPWAPRAHGCAVVIKNWKRLSWLSQCATWKRDWWGFGALHFISLRTSRMHALRKSARANNWSWHTWRSGAPAAPATQSSPCFTAREFSGSYAMSGACHQSFGDVNMLKWRFWLL